MNRFLKYFTLINVILLILIFLPSCGLKQIEDKNGEDDYSLAVLTDEDLTKGMKSFVSVGSATYEKGDTTTIKVNKMSGVRELKKINAKGNSHKISTKINVTSGNLKVVVVCDKKIVKEFSFGEDYFEIENSLGSYKIVIGAESAKFDLVYTVVKK